jgi:hypothetical protein
MTRTAPLPCASSTDREERGSCQRYRSKESLARGGSGPGGGYDNLDGHRLNFVTLRADSDLTELLKGLPNDWCQCPQWG